MKANCKNFVAIDMGATSGRALLGTISDNNLELTELYRFSNDMIQLDGHFYWDIYSIYNHIIKALKVAADKGVPITSIGIDTWGVDVVMVGKDGSILGLPYSYRDPQTIGASDSFFKEVLSKNELYERTGIQVMDFNTLFQLYTMKRNHSSALKACNKILFMPDALSYLLTGKMVTEYTIASTSQMINPYTGTFDEDLLRSIGLKKSKFARLVKPGTKLGYLKEDIMAKTGLPKIPVISVAGHDTASAIAAVPSDNCHFAYLSSGTWSLMGIEVDKPIINEKAASFNITNEGGVNGTIRFLKNITGMWLLEQSLKEWRSQGYDKTYSELVEDAGRSKPFKCFINPDDPSFVNPPSMTQAIRKYCIKTGQEPPEEYAEYARCIFESLAMRYREVFEVFKEMAPFEIIFLHIIGGGSQNELLNQFASNALGSAVISGPAEATAIGNIMMQAYSAGMVSDVWKMRQMIHKCVCTYGYMPLEGDIWNDHYQDYLRYCSGKWSEGSSENQESDGENPEGSSENQESDGENPEGSSENQEVRK